MSTPAAPALPVKPKAHPLVVRLKASFQQLFAFGALLVVYLFFLFTAPNFGSFTILTDILLSSAVIGVMAFGATFVIATSGIDLSVGTGMALMSVMAGIFLSPDWLGLPLWVGLILTLLMGAVLGAVNGFNVAILDIPPFIATLAMMMAASGLALVITKAQPIRLAQVEGFTSLSQGNLIPNFPNAALVFLVVAVIAGFLLQKTLLGRYALSLGSNEEATRLSGINTKKWKLAVYTAAGVFTAIAAILISARSGSAYPGTGLGYELDAIAACVIGGTSLAGGRATIMGTVIGAILVQTLAKGLTLMGVPQEWQKVAVGIVILAAVFADNVRRKKATAV
ncbi:MAG: ABC transporter permease [Actinomycetaceae bacterium]|nr:ABC transporter permease [Actinomycetaceae bacterium]